ncbi:MAG: hypothetical protein AAF694_11845 [Bacteroidota bacterium]
MEHKSDLTLIAFVRESGRRFNNKQLMVLGQLFSEAYKSKYGNPPPKIEQREGDRIIRVNVYPPDFKEELDTIMEDRFPRPKRRIDEEGSPKRKRKRTTRKPDQIRFRRG